MNLKSCDDSIVTFGAFWNEMCTNLLMNSFFMEEIHILEKRNKRPITFSYNYEIKNTLSIVKKMALL